jgi:hypothetical protein
MGKGWPNVTKLPVSTGGLIDSEWGYDKRKENRDQ